MMGHNDGAKVVAGGFLWRFGERITAQVVTFIVSTVLARMLAPEHYGAIAIVNVFITLANVFVSSGLGNALIQKKDTDETDFSSVFFFNVGISLILYTIIFFCAPLFSRNSDYADLTIVFRVMGLRLIVAAVNTVQHAYVAKKMMFKRFFWSTLGGTLFSGILGIAAAYKGYGIWALAIQYMTNTTVDTLVLFLTVKWRPRWRFSWERLRPLASYGWKLLVSELINTGYMELRNLVVGLKYSSGDLAYYNRGKSFPQLLAQNINLSLQSVLFPMMANIQEDSKSLGKMMRRVIRVNSFLITPLVVGLAFVAEPFVRVLLTEKWIGCVPYLQLYCLSYCFIPIQSANIQAIKAVGRSDIYLKQEIIKKALGLVFLLVSIPFGPLTIAVSAVLSSIISALISAIPAKKMLGYSIFEQLKDLANGIVPLAAMCAAVLVISTLPLLDIALLPLEIGAGALVYILIAFLMKNDSFFYVWNIVRRMLQRKKEK